jgi:GTPase SAR1 family protein
VPQRRSSSARQEQPKLAKSLQDSFRPEYDREKAKRLYEQALKDGAAKWMRSKLMLIGDGRVGKTCTLRSLLGKPFIDTDSTCGVTISACEVNRTDVANWTEVPDDTSQLQLVAASICAAKLAGKQAMRWLFAC